MNNIFYNQALSTFSPVLIAGVLAMPLPVIPQQDMAEQGNKSISRAIYHASNNFATYSHLSSIFSGEYSYVAKKLERPWLTSALADFLGHSSPISLEAVDRLILAIRDSYGDVQIDAVMHTDPEEGWTKPVFVVHSGREDFDEVMDLEDKFFANATNDSTLLALLPLVIVSQA